MNSPTTSVAARLVVATVRSPTVEVYLHVAMVHGVAAEAERGARFRELYAMLGLRAAVHGDGTLEITVGAANTKGVMPCGGSG